MKTIATQEYDFYSEFSGSRADALAQLHSIDDILRIEQSQSFKYLVKISKSQSRNFPAPYSLWIDGKYDGLAEWDAYQYLAPLHSKKILQIGGTGTSAITFMLGGAKEACLITPVAEEARLAKELARLAEVEISCKIGVAEDIPFDSESFDGVYAGGCAHHFDTPIAFPEISRVLKKGGRFSAIEPWKAPLYSIGTKILGKREGCGMVQCRPLTNERVVPLKNSFSFSTVVHHGSFLRYPLLALFKLGISISDTAAWKFARADDWIADRLDVRHWGGSVAILAEK